MERKSAPEGIKFPSQATLAGQIWGRVQEIQGDRTEAIVPRLIPNEQECARDMVAPPSDAWCAMVTDRPVRPYDHGVSASFAFDGQWRDRAAAPCGGNNGDQRQAIRRPPMIR